MKQYTYTGPLSGVSLKGHDDIMLHPGAEVKMPEDHVYTKRLLKRGWLQEVPAKKSKSVKETSDAS
ncbi:MAG: hypothetical protein AB7F61_14325 [Desulfobulbus sp.]